MYDEDGYEDDSYDEDASSSAVAALASKLQLSVSSEALSEAVSAAASSIVNSLKNSIESELRQLLREACGAEIKKLAGEEMPKILSEVLREKIVVGGEYSWEQRELEIRRAVHDEFSRALKDLNNTDKRKALIQEAINSFMTKEVQQATKAAIEEYKRDFGKEASRQVLASVMQAVGSDKKLLALLQAANS